ncbi:MAG: hypothetical protein WCO00_04870 [Rhodospirillaceae bacterium]
MAGIPFSHHSQLYQTVYPAPNSIDLRLAAEAARGQAVQTRTAASLQHASFAATAAAHTSAVATAPVSKPVNPNLGNHINIKV